MSPEKQCKHGTNLLNICEECFREAYHVPRSRVLCNALEKVEGALLELESVCYDESLKREAEAIRKALKTRREFFSKDDKE